MFFKLSFLQNKKIFIKCLLVLSKRQLKKDNLKKLSFRHLFIAVFLAKRKVD